MRTLRFSVDGCSLRCWKTTDHISCSFPHCSEFFSPPLPLSHCCLRHGYFRSVVRSHRIEKSMLTGTIIVKEEDLLFLSDRSFEKRTSTKSGYAGCRYLDGLFCFEIEPFTRLANPCIEDA